MGLKVTILGCGNSTGVPMVGNVWGKCDPNEPKNRRMRTSILVEKGDTKIIVDTGPDFREQMNRLGRETRKLDAVLYTHVHPDHTQGIFELRAFYYYTRLPVEIYARTEVLEELRRSFFYLFEDSADGFYKSCLNENVITDETKTIEIGGIKIDILTMDHGNCTTLGYVFDNKIAYTTDVIDIPEYELDRIKGIDHWIVECSYLDGEVYVHANWPLTRKWIEYVKPRKAYLTDMGNLMDYQTVMNVTPDHVIPSHDGLVITA